MKLAIIHLWILACLTYGFAIFMAVQGSLAASIILTLIFLLILISTRWITDNGEN
jgi:mannose/fructose/N-acetylgalactosamine-specific phosphotransferase system component IID